MEQEAKSSSVEQETANKEEAFTHLAQGKRHLLVKDYNEAVTSLGLACTLLSKLYGEFANECGEAYFNYGKALLELARSENDVLDIDGEREESQDSDDGEGEGEEDEKEGNDTESETKNVENGKGDDENKDTDAEKNESETNGTKIENVDSKEENSEEDEENVDNLHLAWEMLEMAKIVFKKQAEENKQMKLKLAEVHLKLGEVGLESENYTQAIEDILTCLQIQIKNLDKHDRCIAETHYQLGMAYTLSSEFDSAIEHYENAVKLLEARIEYLQEREKQGVTSDDTEKNNPFYSIKEEIAEINAILPEVKEKISDVEDCKRETKKALIAGIGPKKEGESSSAGQEQNTSTGTESSFPFSSDSSDAKPVSDISHLVRKKRKLETDSSEEKNTKLPCPDTSKPE